MGKVRQKFIHGNYNRYYGYRNPTKERDKRLDYMQREWFVQKDVLDIGCNTGHVTLSIATQFHPRQIVGIDIDSELIRIARKNIRHYLPDVRSKQKESVSEPDSESKIVSGDDLKSFFPKNVKFIHKDYVPKSDDELNNVEPEQFDTILCLSVTKWIHLNCGDDGLIRCFKKMFAQLREGGRLILEPQPWSSYRKKRKLTEEILATFRSIKIKPDQFKELLLSKDIGFASFQVLTEVPSSHESQGFQRPIYLLTKRCLSSQTPSSE